MKQVIASLACQTARGTYLAFGIGFAISGLAIAAMAATGANAPRSARLQAPICELRMTMPDAAPRVLARGNPGEDCRDMVRRKGWRMDRIPAGYSAVWFELSPVE